MAFFTNELFDYWYNGSLTGTMGHRLGVHNKCAPCQMASDMNLKAYHSIFDKHN